MIKNTLKSFAVLSTIIYSFNSYSVAIPACDTDECKADFQQYKKYSKAGYADAMATLGDLYFNGHGTDKNLEKALKSYKSAAKYGSMKGTHRTAMIYLNNEEYKDVPNGIKYLKKAARNKSSEAAYLLGIIFYKKDFHVRDFDESDKWLTKAYRAKHKQTASFIRSIDKSNMLNTDNYPELLEALSEEPLPKKEINTDRTLTASIQQNTTQVPRDKSIEVITITSDLREMFAYEISSLKNTYPQKGAVSTGTKISGKSCDEILSCGKMDKGQFKILVDNLR
jgi:TPR repeat protein